MFLGENCFAEDSGGKEINKTGSRKRAVGCRIYFWDADFNSTVLANKTFHVSGEFMRRIKEEVRQGLCVFIFWCEENLYERRVLHFR